MSDAPFNKIILEATTSAEIMLCGISPHKLCEIWMSPEVKKIGKSRISALREGVTRAHKLQVALQLGSIRLVLQSSRVSAEQVKQLGLEPEEEAENIENTVRLVRTLRGT